MREDTCKQYKKDFVKRDFPFLGGTKICMRHNKCMGRCYFQYNDREFSIPNMPKLRYAIDLSMFLRKNIIKPVPEIVGQEGFFFEKMDGFNLLFWFLEHKNQLLIFPKTRMLPFARGKVSKVVSHPLFPLKAIHEMIEKERVVPVFEVWGHLIEELGIGHGSVKYSKAVPDLEPILIGLINPETLEFLHPETVLLMSEKYGFRNTLLEIKTIEEQDITRIMQSMERINSIHGYIRKEGVVIHTIIDGKVRMYKVKPISVLKKDVQYGVDAERILQEYAKIRLEYSLIYVATHFKEIIELVKDYILEEHKVNKTIRDRIQTVVAQEIAKELIEEGIDNPEIAGRKGISSIIIHWIIEFTKPS